MFLVSTVARQFMWNCGNPNGKVEEWRVLCKKKSKVSDYLQSSSSSNAKPTCVGRSEDLQSCGEENVNSNCGFIFTMTRRVGRRRSIKCWWSSIEMTIKMMMIRLDRLFHSRIVHSSLSVRAKLCHYVKVSQGCIDSTRDISAWVANQVRLPKETETGCFSYFYGFISLYLFFLSSQNNSWWFNWQSKYRNAIAPWINWN